MAQAESSSHELRRLELRADVAVMRELGVVRWGDVLLEPLPPQASAQAPEPIDPAETLRVHRRTYYETLYNRPVSDAELGMLP